MKIVLILIAMLSFNSFTQQLPQKLDTNNQIIEHDGYVLSYNETCEQANWVFYKLMKSDLVGEKATIRGGFRQDTLIKTGSASYNDYTHSGYDRGHLKPAGDEPVDGVDRKETYYMSNITPQNPSFNRGVWKKLENYVRKQALKSDSLYIVTGGILHDSLQTIGNNDICVPEYFFKVIYQFNDGIMTTSYYLLPNIKSDSPLSTFLVTNKELEEATKMEFSINFE